MKKTFRLLDKNITNPNFKMIIDLCFEKSSYISFTKYYSSIESEQSKNFDLEINNYLVNKIKTTHWYCYYMLDDSRPLEVSVYKADQKVKDILLNTFNNIFLIGNKKPRIAEDLCFFSNDELLLGTVSHERACHIFPQNNQTLNSFLNIANWEETEFLEKELIKLNV